MNITLPSWLIKRIAKDLQGEQAVEIKLSKDVNNKFKVEWDSTIAGERVTISHEYWLESSKNIS